MSVSKALASFTLAAGALIAAASQAQATHFTFNQTVDLTNAKITVNEFDSPVTPVPSFTLGVGDVVDYNVTFSHGKLVTGTGGLPNNYGLFASFDGPASINQGTCFSGPTKVTIGSIVENSSIAACSGFFWGPFFAGPGDITGFGAEFTVQSIEVLKPGDASFNAVDFQIFPLLDDTAPLAIVLDAPGTPVPEPAGLALLALSLAGTAALRTRRRSRD